MENVINSITGRIIHNKFESFEINGKTFISRNDHKIVETESGVPRVYIRFYGTSIEERWTMQIHVIDLFVLNRIDLYLTNIDGFDIEADMGNFETEFYDGMKEVLYLESVSDVRHLFDSE